MTNQPPTFIILTWDNINPQLIGPFDSDHEATAWLSNHQASWDDHHWNHFSGFHIRESTEVKLPS
jgi:hypothetical protein